MEQELSSRERRSLSLVKKGKKGIFQAVFSRTGLVSCLLILNICLTGLLFWRFYEYLPHIYGGSAILSAVMVLTVLNGRHDPSARVTWLIIVLCAPVFGSVLYFYIRGDVGHRQLKKRIRDMIYSTRELVPQDPEVAEAFERVDPGAAGLARYLRRTDHFTACANTDAEYFPSGEAMFSRLLEELEKAKEFIFLEYFIVE